MKITKDHAVFFDYEVRNSRSEVLDSSAQGGPMAYVHGYASIIPGLEKALEGKTAGSELNVTVPPVEAYGLRDERRMGQVDRSIFPAGAEIKPGMRFRATSEHGTDNVVVVGVDGDTITVDANHPLAGETLTFQVTIRDVRPATPEEISHGHVHHAHSHEHDGCCGGDGHKHDDGGCCGGHGHGDGGGCGCH
ncbi:MAG: peptidylprolyl isomerase [Chthoniobacterales bacterium]|nr:peptidylprolyl isomerase [Chthoniobacterales bacterium]